MRELLFLKSKLREAHGYMERLMQENNHLKDDNQFLRRLLWAEMSGKNEGGEEKEIEMDEVMEDV